MVKIRTLKCTYGEMFSMQALEDATFHAAIGKHSFPSISAFLNNIEQNLAGIYAELISGSYIMSDYHEFFIHDPKKRLIMALPFKDRIVHWAIYQILNPWFDRIYIDNSFACRVGKGSHIAIEKLYDVERNMFLHNKNPYALKLDVAKYFHRVDHEVLLHILDRYIKDIRIMELLEMIICNDGKHPFGVELTDDGKSTGNRIRGKGIPIGNLTSQLFANIYLNVLDQFCKHDLHVKNYFRYMDDLIIIEENKFKLKEILKRIKEFLFEELQLITNKKTKIFPLSQGVDFCGYRVMYDHIRIRGSSHRKMLKAIKHAMKCYLDGDYNKKQVKELFASYYGMLIHADTGRFRKILFGTTGKPLFKKEKYPEWAYDCPVVIPVLHSHNRNKSVEELLEGF